MAASELLCSRTGKVVASFFVFRSLWKSSYCGNRRKCLSWFRHLACGSKSLNESGRNAKAAERLYRERFPNRLYPSSNVTLKLINRVRSSGSVVPNRKGVGGIDRTVRTPNTEDEVLETFNEDGTRSIRNVANTMGLTKSTVQRILRDNRMHGYHYTKVQHLLPEDYAPRVEFCTWLLEQHAKNPLFLKNILFTDESYFSRQGTFNSHNFHVWATENPHEVFIRSFQNHFSRNPR
jgi:hypothetical protein